MGARRTFADEGVKIRQLLKDSMVRYRAPVGNYVIKLAPERGHYIRPPAQFPEHEAEGGT